MKNQLLQLILKRRSVRQYTSRHYTKEIYDEIMKAGLAAPTSFGHQAIELVLVQNKEIIKAIGRCKVFGGSQVNGADAVIVVLVKTDDPRQSEFWIEDGAIASGYMLLAAEQYNLGACWVHVRNRMGHHLTTDQEIRTLLSVPDGYTVLNLIALGEKGEEKPPHHENELNLHAIHHESFIS